MTGPFFVPALQSGTPISQGQLDVCATQHLAQSAVCGGEIGVVIYGFIGVTEPQRRANPAPVILKAHTSYA